ncbi:flavin reductase family protein [Bordetella sp. BOR01]|uniref:flavin reductase family protein n=1 Tax=Bordetella sp. BOR01 TaxID=2854779 RepID=UPI001C471A7A|nr:flavin reductase family protein [Bordetella sp. BOR01]MBV7486491.1 flavin reductase family protein [Bordetella sp. BOR01]
MSSPHQASAASTHFYEPSKGHRLPHSPFKAIIAPRPIGWISTIDLEGRVNLAPYSFFNAMNESPPILGFCTMSRKDTMRNIEATGEFVANLATYDLAEQMNLSAAAVRPDVDEMQLAGLAAAPSVMVRPPRVADAPAALECRMLNITQLKDLDGKQLDVFQISGQVVGVHINAEYLVDGIFDTAKARNLARCGYRGFYASADKLFEMTRPSDAFAAAQG